MKNSFDLLSGKTSNWTASEQIVPIDGSKKIKFNCTHVTWYRKSKIHSFKQWPFKQWPLNDDEFGVLINQIAIKEIEKILAKFSYQKIRFIFPPYKKSYLNPPVHYLFSYIYNHHREKIIVVNSNDYKLSYLKDKKNRTSEIKNAYQSFKINKITSNDNKDAVYIYIDDIYTSGTTMLFTLKFLESNGFINIKRITNTNDERFQNVFGLFLGRVMPYEFQKDYVKVLIDE